MVESSFRLAIIFGIFLLHPIFYTILVFDLLFHYIELFVSLAFSFLEKIPLLFIFLFNDFNCFSLDVISFFVVA